mgnify:CR=1 FL=1
MQPEMRALILQAAANKMLEKSEFVASFIRPVVHVPGAAASVSSPAASPTPHPVLGVSTEVKSPQLAPVTAAPSAVPAVPAASLAVPMGKHVLYHSLRLWRAPLE